MIRLTSICTFSVLFLFPSGSIQAQQLSLDSMCTALEKLNPELAHELTTMVRLSADHNLLVNKVQYDNQSLTHLQRNERALGDAIRIVDQYTRLYSASTLRAIDERRRIDCAEVYFAELMERDQVDRIRSLDDMFARMFENIMRQFARD